MLDYDHEAARYDATRGGDARADAAAQAIEALLPAAARAAVRIADVGCGTGIVTRRLLRPGRSVIGVDQSAGITAAGRERVDSLSAELAGLPDQDRARPDPVYEVAALRKA